jgi:hypothetical protein
MNSAVGFYSQYCDSDKQFYLQETQQITGLILHEIQAAGGGAPMQPTGSMK